jgi:hypothetical protein
MIMNLGKLLGAGKSFFAGQGSVSYREDKRVYLPKFNAEKNPFTPKPTEPTPVAPKSVPVTAPAAKKISAPATTSAVVPVAAQVAAKAQEVRITSTAKPTRAIKWTDKLNPFRAPEPIAPPMVGAVQVELSLDAVKPIGNDLEDADIEVVPVKSRTAAPVDVTLLQASHEAWEIASERLVKSA